MTKFLVRLAPALLAAALGACAVIPDAPIVDGIPLPQGSAVALRQPVQLGAVVVTPMEVVEDSRCPADVTCAWAGRLVVKTRVDGAGWRETADLTLGEPAMVRSTLIRLTSGNPAPASGSEIAAADYRFTFEAR